jgi:hypothetical protein
MKTGLITALLLGPLAALHAADFIMADKGIAPAPIIVFKDAPPRTRDAAVALAGYIAKITGAKPAVMDGAPSPAPERAIWIGVQPALKALFPKSDFDFKRPEETLIVADEMHLVIAGRDRWDAAHLEAKGRLSTKTGVQQEYGTANAVYTFIRDQLGVRWLWPGEEDVIRRERISVAPGETRYHPQLRARAGLFTKLALGDHKEGPDLEWARVQRVQLDSMELDGGHGFGDWWARYGSEHPEYFAAAPDGSRKPVRSDPKNTKLCASNPMVWRQWLAEVEERMRANPMQRVFNVSPNDGYTSGHCVCANCRAWDHPDGEKVTWTCNDGTKYQGVSQTDRDVRFANTLARLLKERFPGRELYVQLNAYGLARNPPIGVAPDDNVIISSVANFAMRSPAERDTPMKQHAAWAQTARHLMWRPNLGNPAGLSWGLPDTPFTQLAGDFRFAADAHCLGLFFDMFWYHWSTQGPLYYELAHLAWNPRADAAALMDDYHRRCYGPAAAEMKAYWELLERTRMEFVNAKQSRMRSFDIADKYTPEVFAAAQAHLDAAFAKLAGAEEKFRRRLHFTRCGFEFTQAVVNIRAAMKSFEAGKGKDAEAKARVLAQWQRIETMRKEFPAWAINWQAVLREPAANTTGKRDKRIEGLHPDSPITARTLKEMNAAGVE